MKLERPLDSWDRIVREAENILSGNEILPIDALISIIKRINPTSHISLSPDDKEIAYRLKSDLQSLLLTTYGELFDLEPVKWDENIVLLRYRLSPLVDACHAKMHILSESALAQVRKGDVVPVKKQKKKAVSKRPAAMDINTLQGIVDQARIHIDNFEYDSAGTLLSGISIDDKDEIHIFLKGIAILLDELGAFDVAMDRLFALPETMINDSIREITATVYWLNNRFTDARGIFEQCAIKELKKESIFKYADILAREGEAKASLELLNYAESMSGHIEEMNALRHTLYKKLKEEAEPYLEKGQREFDENNFEEAEKAAITAIYIFPQYDEARELLRIVRDIDTEATVVTLWNSYHDAKTPAERLSILKKLQAKDPVKKKEILNLIEKATQEEKRMQEEQAISHIADHLAASDYGKAFDRMYLLLKENGCTDLMQFLSEEHPQIREILSNTQLLRLKIDEARESWISYLHLREISLDDDVKVLSLLKRAGKGFSDVPEYIEIKNRYSAILANRSRKKICEYFRVLESENISHDKADEMAVLIKNELATLPLEESDGHKQRCQDILHKIRHDFTVNLSRKRYHEYCKEMERPDMSLEKAEHLLSMMSKEAGNMPVDECELSNKRCQKILNKLQQVRNTESFRKSLMYGDTESAASLKKTIDDIIAVTKIESEIASLFAVEAIPLNVAFGTDMYPFSKADSKEGISFIDCREGEAFLNLSYGDDHHLIILDLETKETSQYKMKNFNYAIDKVILNDHEKKEYHLLCRDNDNLYFYIKAVFDREGSQMLGHVNLSTLIGLDKAASIDHTFYLTGKSPNLYILFTPDDDDWDNRMFVVADIFNGKLLKKKKVEYQNNCHVMVPADPPRFVIGHKQICLYNNNMQKIKTFSTYKDFEWCDFITVDPGKKLIYAFIDGGRDADTAKSFFLIFDYSLNIISKHDDINPKYDFLAQTRYYDSKRDILVIGERCLYDYRTKRMIKSFDWVDFDRTDVILSSGSLDELSEIIKSDGYGIEFLSEDNSIDLLNNILCLPDFYDRVLLIKPDLKLSPETVKSFEKIGQYRIMNFSEIPSYEQWEIKRLNRSLIQEVYPDYTPFINKLFDHCFFFRQETSDYYICNYNAGQKKLTVIDISAYIDEIVDSGKQNMG